LLPARRVLGIVQGGFTRHGYRIATGAITSINASAPLQPFCGARCNLVKKDAHPAIMAPVGVETHPPFTWVRG
jgi:hypothetical protein